MDQHVILTAIGNDRPGLVEELSQFIFERGGNIEDSRMVNLRGQFAMMVLVGGAEATIARLSGELGALAQASGLHAQVRPATAVRADASAQALPHRLTIKTLDQPGLVHRVAHLLRGLNINIESLDSRLTPAPITGAPMFEMDLVISIARATPLATVRQQVGALCDQLNIDWQLGGV